ncbi:HD domain-containing protein [Alkalilimnicola sp. S0819]|uniref:HD domain-containing protein n=1 Tax=Alkalilimnicola sp. S0819 TaxID=2613922 RepID=UPI0012627F62|nr:HD domain-containing protein [Alkalilimnicola sp. S0819]KAB7623624.1 HD domain-containing protein [Alkalilimnicola sp. S0819]MPQ16748.1 HD domain-containing protein [Alkalilimnicola sp. S0819]
MTPRFTQALAVAAEAHERQARKGTDVPYITHPVAVAALVARYGGDEDQQIAALLHDVLEDAGEHWTPRVRAFGEVVYEVVLGCTDGLPDARGNKPEWHTRKRAYLAQLDAAPERTLLVAGCDKLHNLQSIHLDLTEIGPGVFERFRAGREGTLWYYEQLVALFQRRRSPLAPPLNAELQAVLRKAEP